MAASGKEVLSQRQVGWGIKGAPKSEEQKFEWGDPRPRVGGSLGAAHNFPSTFKGPRIGPEVYDKLILEGAHTYVTQELQPYLDIFTKNNPKEKMVKFHVGEPSEKPLNSILKEGERLHREGKKESFGYQSNKGLDEVAEAWAGHLNRWGIYADPVQPGEVQLGASGKTYAWLVGQVLKRDGVDAALFTPMYPGHATAALEYTSANKEPWKHGIHGIPVTKEKHWQNDPEETVEILNEQKPGLVIVCNPQNPTGGVMNEKTLKPFVDYGKENPEVVFFEDGVYHPTVFDKNFKTLAQNKDIQGQVIYLDSSSKDLSDPGARVSALVIRDEMEQVRKGVLASVNHYISSGPTTESLKLIPALSKEGDKEIVERVDLYKKKKEAVVEAFKEVGLDPNNPGGAFYLLAKVPEEVTASKFAKLAAQDAGVTFLPAKYFGSWKNTDGSYKIKNPKGEPLYPEATAEKYIRVAYVGEKEDMANGIRRLAPLMEQIRAKKVA